MGGRTSWSLALAVAVAIAAAGGCAKKTPEQRAQERANKQAIAQAKADGKRQAEERRRAEAEARAEQERAAAQARSEQKRLAEQRQLAEAGARAEQEKADAQARVAREKAAAAADTERERAAAQERLQSEEAAAAARLNARHAEAEARERKRQAAAARKGRKPKPEKAQAYPDDEQWVVGDPYFHPENRTRQLDRHVESMAAAGAASDASLYDHHFDGAELNALGRSKVALMLAGAPRNQQLTIYVAPTGATNQVQARMAAVDRFWKESQWAAAQVRMRQGVNPEQSMPASAGLAGLRKMEQEEQTGNTRTYNFNFTPGTGGTTTGGGGGGGGME